MHHRNLLERKKERWRKEKELETEKHKERERNEGHEEGGKEGREERRTEGQIFYFKTDVMNSFSSSFLLNATEYSENYSMGRDERTVKA